MVLNAIDTKALVAACSHNKLEPNENGQYNVQEFTFKVKLGFQSNNCLDLFTLDIKERKGDDGKVVQEPKSEKSFKSQKALASLIRQQLASMLGTL